MLIAADSTVTIAGALVSVLGATAVIVGLVLSRRSEHEANDTQEELNDYTILRGVVKTLQEETNRLQTSLRDTNEELDKANAKAVTLNHELDSAQVNVRILSDHIRRHLPEVPFPKLRVMNDVG